VKQAGKKRVDPGNLGLFCWCASWLALMGKAMKELTMREGQRSPAFGVRNRQQGELQGDEHDSVRLDDLFFCCTILRVVQQVCS
jgi:hypothetical protein